MPGKKKPVPKVHAIHEAIYDLVGAIQPSRSQISSRGYLAKQVFKPIDSVPGQDGDESSAYQSARQLPNIHSTVGPYIEFLKDSRKLETRGNVRAKEEDPDRGGGPIFTHFAEEHTFGKPQYNYEMYLSRKSNY